MTISKYFLLISIHKILGAFRALPSADCAVTLWRVFAGFAEGISSDSRRDEDCVRILIIDWP